MKTRTVTIIVIAGRDAVFAFLSNIENLPLWATEFCEKLWLEDGHWKVRTSQGDIYVSLKAHPTTGVIDLFAGPTLDTLEIFPVRVWPAPDGTAISFTFAQSPDLPDEIYERQYRSLLIEMRGLIGRFGGGTLHAPPPELAPFHANIVTARLAETAQFYKEQFGFRVAFYSDVYVHLVDANGVQLGLLRDGREEQPAQLRTAAEGQGFWLSLDVEDVDAEHERLAASGVEIISPPEDRPWGERVFVARDPNGVLIYIAHKLTTEDCQQPDCASVGES